VAYHQPGGQVLRLHAAVKRSGSRSAIAPADPRIPGTAHARPLRRPRDERA
jgi:hypothetical protein